MSLIMLRCTFLKHTSISCKKSKHSASFAVLPLPWTHSLLLDYICAGWSVQAGFSEEAAAPPARCQMLPCLKLGVCKGEVLLTPSMSTLPHPETELWAGKVSVCKSKKYSWNLQPRHTRAHELVLIYSLSTSGHQRLVLLKHEQWFC